MSSEEWSEFERRRTAARDTAGRVFLIVVGLGVVAMAWNYSNRKIDVALAEVTGSSVVAETPVAPSAPAASPGPTSQRSLLSQPAARPVAVSRQTTRIVFECVVDGQKVYSDGACGENAIEKHVVVGQPDPENAARNRYLTRQAQYGTYSGTDRSQVNGSRSVATRNVNAICAQIDQQVDWINSRMRQGYGSAEGERMRESLRHLKSQRYDLRCGR